ncbi:MAG TPA: hypothetical protein VGR47_05800 [Terracidiphilus sp.]|nr:hypothetical protein [Terracidiphilus sp.]
MHIDPMQSWRSLTENYAQMSDGELIALAEDFRDLTDTARQVLRDEMRKRNLGDPASTAWTPPGFADAQRNSSGDESADGEAVSTDEFVWKHVLRENCTREEASQIFEVLKRAGVESWIDRSRNYLPLADSGFRVLVASDELEAASAVLGQPIPSDIVEQSQAEQAVYEPPVCPACGAPDPILESADPANCWKCEVCGRQWSDALEPGRETSPTG